VAPSGLYARLCHAFLVANFFLILIVKQFRKLVNKVKAYKIIAIFAGMLGPRKGLGLEARKPGLGLMTAGLGLGLVGVLASASCNLASRPRQ